MTMWSPARPRRSSPLPPARRSHRGGASSWRSAAATRRGRCCAHWPPMSCPGSRCTSFRWTSGSRRQPIPTETSRICAQACSIMPRCPPDHIHAMPVEAADLDRAAAQYALTLRDLAGSPPVLDLIHLGLGPDGHTASLVPGDPVLDITGADVAATGFYNGRRRMTLTFPIINRSRLVLWLVTGGEKAATLVRLRDGDRSIPASRVRQDRSLVLADRAAAERLGSSEKLEAQK